MMSVIVSDAVSGSDQLRWGVIGRGKGGGEDNRRTGVEELRGEGINRN